MRCNRLSYFQAEKGEKCWPLGWDGRPRLEAVWPGFSWWCRQSPLCAGSLSCTFATHIACMLSALVSNESEGDNSPQFEAPQFFSIINTFQLLKMGPRGRDRWFY